MIVVPTIPHSGSMFVVRSLLGHLPQTRNPKRGDGVFFAHVYESRMEEITDRLREGHKGLSPIRPPVKVWSSWKARQKNLSELPGLWENLMALSVCFLPIEHASRQDHLRRIEKYLGMPLKTDWKPIASSGLKADLTDQEIREAQEFEPFYQSVSQLEDR